MQYTISAAAFLALISAAQAQTAGFDPITTPAKDEVVSACSHYTVKWDYTTTYAGTVSVQLLEGASPTTLQLGPILASGIDNSLGSFSWAVDCALGNSATYGIKITYDKDATGATFQYSNPFSIKGATPTAPTAPAAPATTNAAAQGYQAANNDDQEAATIYQTEYLTITSCAATVTNCPARSTVVSTTSYPVVPTSAPVPTNAGSESHPTGYQPVAPPASPTNAPVYPAGNGTVPTGGSGSFGTVTLSTSKTPTGTGSGSGAAVTTAPVTAGAGRVALGGAAGFAGLVAAVFAL